MSPIPANWTQLRAAMLARRDDDIRELARNARNVARVLARPVPVLAGLFVAPTEVLAGVLAISGADAARDHFHLLDQALPGLLAHGDQVAISAPASAMAVISYVALARCAGVPGVAGVGDAAHDLAARWLPILARHGAQRYEATRRTAALAAVAAGCEDLVPALDGGGPLVPRIGRRDEGVIAGPNIAGFTRHLAELLAGSGSGEAKVDAVEDDWWSVLHAFPLTLAADGVRWIDLVWAAEILMVRFEQRPASDVGVHLPAMILQLSEPG